MTVASVALFARFFKGNLYWAFFEDDFFYYAEVAKRLAVSHVSSFDGIHLTNGYHPLWLVLMTLVYKAFPGFSFFVLIEFVGLIAILVFYFAALRCFTYFEVAPSLRRLATLTFALHALLIFRYGMEVTLALPLAFVALAYVLRPDFQWTGRQGFVYGFLASLTILARLDAIFLFALLLAAQLFSCKLAQEERFRRLLTYCAGGFLFPLYLVANVVLFQTLLPISGQAKQLKPLFPPTMTPVRDFIVHPDFLKAAFAYPAILAALAGVYVLSRRRVSRSPTLFALFAFPAVHLAEMCLLSDWHIWPWYYYSLSFAAFAGLVVCLRASVRSPVIQRELRSPMATMYAMSGFLCFYVAAYAVVKGSPQFAVFGGFVATYAQGHPGMYAMGDCAGSAGYFAGSPVVQLEGLMMDKLFIERIQARTPLAEILKIYHVDYYATIQNPVKRNGCFLVSEPRQAGPTSPKMVGRICVEPLASKAYGDQSVGIFRASDVLLP